MFSIRRIATFTFSAVLAIDCCRAAGGRLTELEQLDHHQYHHAEESNSFGEINLPLGGAETSNAFGQGSPFDPDMYGGYPHQYSHKHSYAPLLHSSPDPQIDYASYPYLLSTQELPTQDFWHQHQQHQVPQIRDVSTSFPAAEQLQTVGDILYGPPAVPASALGHDLDHRDDNGREEEGEQAPSSTVVYDILRHGRELLEKEWTRRQLSTATYSPEDLAAEIAEVKITNPRYGWAISKESTRMVEVDLRKTHSDPKERKEYHHQFKRAKDNCRNRVNYIKRQWALKGTGEELPIEVLLDQFRGAQSAQRKRRIRQPKNPAEAVQEERAAAAALERTTASAIFADFLNRLLGSALSSGQPYSPELIGSLLPLYSTDYYSPEQVRYYMAIYLRQIQGASEGEVQAMYAAASTASGHTAVSQQQQQQQQREEQQEQPSGSRRSRGNKPKGRRSQ